MDEHQDVQEQAVPDPDEQRDLDEREGDERPTPPQTARDLEAEAAGRDVAERVDDRVARVAERGRGLAVAVDDVGGVLDDLSRGFERDRQRQTPAVGEPRR